MDQDHKNTFCTFSFILFFSFLNVISYGQSNKFSLIVEYSPYFSKLTNETIDENYKLSHLGTFKVEYETGLRINPSIGIAFMNTGERLIRDLNGQFDIDEVKFSHNYNYLMIPIGVKFRFDDFLFIQPEFGIGYNLSNKTKQVTTFTNGDKEVERNEIGIIFGEFNKVALPIFLTIGTELSFKQMEFLIGVKAYYNTKQVIKDVPRENHSYGFGISFGLKV